MPATVEWRQFRRSVNSIGAARAVLALGSLSTLLLTDRADLFVAFVPSASDARCVGIGQVGLFCLSEAITGDQSVGVLIGVIVLIGVLSGFATRSLSIPHFWVAWSISENVVLVEGGDQVNAAVTLLLVPWLLVTPSGNAWSPTTSYRTVLSNDAFAAGAALLVRGQLSVVYLVSAIAKFAVPQWADGTALWYWLQVPTFGLAPDQFTAIAPVLQQPIIMVSATYAVMLFELALALSVWSRGRVARAMLLAGVAFHGAIALVFGLWSFGITMAGVLLLCRALQSADGFFIGVSRRSDLAMATKDSCA